jgi:hypothetical protein
MIMPTANFGIRSNDSLGSTVTVGCPLSEGTLKFYCCGCVVHFIHQIGFRKINYEHKEGIGLFLTEVMFYFSLNTSTVAIL